MLQSFRDNSRNAIIYLLFGILIAAFVLSFGPGNRGCGGSPSVSWAARIGDHVVSEAEFRSAFIASGGGATPMSRAQQLRELVLEAFIQRELLAEEATRLGFAVSEQEAEDAVASGHMMLLGRETNESDYFKNGKFNYEKWKVLVQNHLGLSIPAFLEIERRELLAERMRGVLRASSTVSVDEVKADWLNQASQVNLEFVRFTARPGDVEALPSPAEIDGYIKEHEADLKKQFEERSFLYKKLDHEVKLREIVFELAKDAPAATVEAAKKRALAVADKARAGTPFADLVKGETSDEQGKKRLGLVGWRKKGFTGLPDAVEAEVLAAKKGALVGPAQTDRGLLLLSIEDVREGDVPFESAARDLAEEALKQEGAKARAKADADKLLAGIKGGKKLEELTASSAGSDAEEASVSADRPKLQETGLFSRRGEAIQSIGVSKDLARRAFELPVGEVSGPFAVGSGWVVVRVKEKKVADPAEFDKQKDELVKTATERRAMQAVGSAWPPFPGPFVKERCTEAKSQGRVKINDELLSYDGKGTISKYEPCQNPLGGLF
jgi:peptidyl-prolyl cis-trans isomerase D